MEDGRKNKEYQVFYAYKEGEYIRKKLVKDEDLKCEKFRYIQLRDKNKKLLVCITRDEKGNVRSVPLSLLIHKDDPDAKYILRRFRVVFIDKEKEIDFLPEIGEEGIF